MFKNASTEKALLRRVKISPLIGGDRAIVTAQDGTVLGVIIKTTIGGVWEIEGDPTYGYRSRVGAAAAVIRKWQERK